MPNRFQRAVRRMLIGADPLSAPATASPSPTQAGESNLVDPLPAKTDGGAPGASESLVPMAGTLVKSQVAERWISNIASQITPELIEGVLAEAVSGTLFNQFQLFERMEERCPELRIALHKHKMKAAHRNPRIVPPDKPFNPELAKRKADFAGKAFGQIRDWQESAYNLLDAVGKGLSGLEIDWQTTTIDGKRAVIIDRMPWVNHQHWGYWWDKPELQLFPDLFNRAYHVDIPARKFILFHHLTKSGHPSRAALLRPLAWYFLIYLYALKDWATLAETFGVDLAYAFAKKDANKEVRGRIVSWLQRIAARCAVFDIGTEVHIERAAGTGAPPQEALVKFCADKMLELIIGSTLSTQAGTKGARSLGLVQQDDTEELVDWTCVLFAGRMTSTGLRWLSEFNFAEPGDNPIMELPGANRRDLAAMANVINILVGLGMRVPESWAHAQFDIPEPKEIDAGGEPQDDSGIERILTPSKNGSADQLRTDQGGDPLTGRRMQLYDHRGRPLIGVGIESEAIHGGAFSTATEQDAQRALDKIREQAIKQGRDTGAFDKIIGPVKNLLTGRGDPTEMLSQLKTARDQMNPDELAGVAKEMFLLSELVARATVLHQTERS